MSTWSKFFGGTRAFDAPPVWLADLVQWLRTRLIGLTRKVVPPQVALIELASSHWLARAIGVAAQLDIATKLQQGPLSVEQIAAETNTHAPSLRRLLRALSSEGIFKELADGRFQLTPMAEGLADGERSLKHLVLLNFCEYNWALFGKLDYCVATGEDAVEHLYGKKPFDHIHSNKGLSELFNLAMGDTSRLTSTPISGVYDFSQFSRLVDIGGCSGLLLANILKRSPRTSGIVLDHPTMESAAKSVFREHEIADRCEFHCGDFFEEVPAGADGYLMKNILHDWSDEQCQTILQNVHRAMADNAVLLVVEAIVPSGNRPDFSKMMDLQMLAGTSGGRERTRQEFDSLLATAGFRINSVVPTATPFSILECVRCAR